VKRLARGQVTPPHRHTAQAIGLRASRARDRARVGVLVLASCCSGMVKHLARGQGIASSPGRPAQPRGELCDPHAATMKHAFHLAVPSPSNQPPPGSHLLGSPRIVAVFAPVERGQGWCRPAAAGDACEAPGARPGIKLVGTCPMQQGRTAHLSMPHPPLNAPSTGRRMPVGAHTDPGRSLTRTHLWAPSLGACSSLIQATARDARFSLAISASSVVTPSTRPASRPCWPMNILPSAIFCRTASIDVPRFLATSPTKSE
jgi:hypothetical protein